MSTFVYCYTFKIVFAGLLIKKVKLQMAFDSSDQYVVKRGAMEVSTIDERQKSEFLSSIFLLNLEDFKWSHHDTYIFYLVGRKSTFC